MKDLNILILSAGRRVELIECFKNAATKVNVDSKIVATDITTTAPAIYFADKFYLVPKIGEDNYINSIINICRKEKIELIVPTIDTELLILAKNKKNIEEETNAKVLVSDYRVIQICRNKNNTQKFFEENSFGVPMLYDKNNLLNIKFPVFIKPIDGSSSINTFKVKNREELDFFINYIKEPLIQEFIEGTEYTVDVFCDFKSQPITIVPRERIAVRNGEILKGKIIKDKEIIESVKKVIKVLNPIGQITIQCIKNKDKIMYIEINPRFGGGAPMSIKAGADSCANLYKLLKKEELHYNEDYKENTLFLRFDNSIMLNENMEKIQ